MSYGHFTIEEREIIALRLAEGEYPTQIAKELGRHHSSVSAEIRRNSIEGVYYPFKAQVLAKRRRRESKCPWKMKDPRVAENVKRGLKQRWERGLNENTNGLLRQYFHKGTDFSKITPYRLKKVENEVNGRPRKTLGYRTPQEVMRE